MKKFTKTTALVLSLSMASSIIAGCDLPFGNKDNKAVEEAISSYMDNVIKAKFDKAAKSLVEQDEDEDEESESFKALYEALDDDGADIMDAILATTSYEISDIEADSDDEKGKAKLVITTVDLGAVVEDLDDDYEPSDLIDAIEDCKDTTENKIKLSLVLDDDEWLIESDSDIADCYFSMVEDADISFGPSLTEEGIKSYIDECFDSISRGEYEEYINNDDGFISSFGDFSDSDSQELMDKFKEFLGKYFSKISHETIVNSIDEEAMKAYCTINTTVPCATDIVASLTNNHDFLVTFMAYSIAGLEVDFDNLDAPTLIKIIDGMIQGTDSASTENLSAEVTVYLDEEGEMHCDGISDCLFGEADSDSMGEPDLSDDELLQLMQDAVEYAYDNALITEDQYNEYSTYFTGSTTGSGDTGSATGTETGTATGTAEGYDENGLPLPNIQGNGFMYYLGADLFSIVMVDGDVPISEVHAGDTTLSFEVTTIGTYPAGKTYVVLAYGPNFTEDNNVFAITSTEETDTFFMTVMPEGGLQSGEYTLCLVDSESTTDPIVTVVKVTVA